MPDSAENDSQQGGVNQATARRVKPTPVFVDRSGQRLRRVRVTAWSSSSIVVMALVLVVAGLLGGIAGTPGGWTRPDAVAIPATTATASSTAKPTPKATTATSGGKVTPSARSTASTATVAVAAASPVSSSAPSSAPGSVSTTASTATASAAPVGSAHATKKPTAPPGKP